MAASAPMTGTAGNHRPVHVTSGYCRVLKILLPLIANFKLSSSDLELGLVF